MGEEFPGNGIGFFSKFGDENFGAKEGGDVAGLAVWEVGDIDDDLIHGDASEDRAKGIVNADWSVLT